MENLSMENQSFKAVLVTRGRKSGKLHSVWLRAVWYQEAIYFSRRNTEADWLKNALAYPDVEVEFDGKKYFGKAELINDELLAEKISHLKYPGQKKAEEPRIILRVKLTCKLG